MTDTTDRQAVTRDDALAFADEAFRNRDITFSHRDIVDMTGALDTFLRRHRLASVSSASAEAADHVPDAGKMVPEPVPATNQAGEVELRDALDWAIAEIEGRTRYAFDIYEREEQYGAALAKAKSALATQPATSQEKDDMTSSNTLADCFVDNWQRECTDGRVTKHTDMMVRQFAYYAFAHLPQPYREHTPAQPATSQEGEDEDAIHDCGNLGWCQAPGCCSRHGTAATPTPPTLSEDLQEALKPFADIAQGEVWERFIADSKMNLRISNGSGSAHYCFINAESFEAARAALAQVKAS